jgi:hypothetical protein
MPDDEDNTVDNNVLLQLIGSDYVAYVAPTAEELEAQAAEYARAERDYKLQTEVDPIAGNALRWAALTSADREAWADYREALLNITDQARFPFNVIWPTKPE